MSDREAFEVRLQALGLHLAAAFDLAAVMHIRADIVKLIDDSAAPTAQYKYREERDRGHIELRRRARELKRDAELFAGEQLLLMAKRGERQGCCGDMHHTGITLADLGFRHRTISSRWQRRARLASVPSFGRRVAEASTIEEVQGLVAETLRQGRAGANLKDRHVQMVAVARRTAAKRRGGELLLAGPPDGSGLSLSTSKSWTRLARLTTEQFWRAVLTAHKESLVRSKAAQLREPAPQIVNGVTSIHQDREGHHAPPGLRRRDAAGLMPR
jgi:hypothetical protein